MSRATLWAIGALAFAGAASAHHSFSVFDMTTEKTIEGEIVEFQWTNPHTWTWVNVKNADGTVTNQLRVKIANRTSAPQTYRVSIADDPGATIIAPELPLTVAEAVGTGLLPLLGLRGRMGPEERRRIGESLEQIGHRAFPDPAPA